MMKWRCVKLEEGMACDEGRVASRRTVGGSGNENESKMTHLQHHASRLPVRRKGSSQREREEKEKEKMYQRQRSPLLEQEVA